MKIMLLEIVEEFEIKLQRRLTAEEFEFLKWMIEKHVKGIDE